MWPDRLNMANRLSWQYLDHQLQKQPRGLRRLWLPAGAPEAERSAFAALVQDLVARQRVGVVHLPHPTPTAPHLPKHNLWLIPPSAPTLQRLQVREIKALTLCAFQQAACCRDQPRHVHLV